MARHDPTSPVHAPILRNSGGSSTRDSDRLDTIAKLVQIVGVVLGFLGAGVGVLISVLSYNAARQSESLAREAEAKKPFLELRQKVYLEAVRTAAILANSGEHTDEEVANARKRFRELYVAELSLVEGIEVEGSMKALAGEVDEKLLHLSDEQKAAYHLAHALRDSLRNSWGFSESVIDNRNK
jgi:hypothetical protein